MSLGSALLSLVLAAVPPAPAGKAADQAASKLDAPTDSVWKGERAWDDAAEARYGEFVSTIGHAVADRRCRTLAACLNDPAINPLWTEQPAKLRFHADCADVPYILRAYFALHEDLPFAYTRSMQGRGRDARYYKDARPVGLCSWRESPTPRSLLQRLSGVVHSGYFRTAPRIENADFYQADISRQAIRPGTLYYDPNGHVVVVYELRPDGDVLFFDGHPDGFLTHGVLSEKNVRGGESQGGGFKNFRPIAVQKVGAQAAVVQQPNARIPEFGSTAPFDSSRYVVDGKPVRFHTWVRARLAAATQVAAGKVAGEVLKTGAALLGRAAKDAVGGSSSVSTR